MSITPPDPHRALKALRAAISEVIAMAKVAPDAEPLTAVRDKLLSAELDLQRYIAQSKT